ncbi:MAG: RICIN domain-containing protein [Steroidobacter sp.]
MKKCLSDSLLGLVIIASLFAVTQKANAFTLRNYQTGLCLGIAAGNPNPGTALVTWTCDGTPSQQWLQINLQYYSNYWGSGYIEAFGASDFGSNQDFILSSGLAGYGVSGFNIASTSVIGVSGGIIKDGTPLIEWGTYNYVVNQRWQSVPMGSDFSGHECYIFENLASPGTGEPYVIGVLGGNPKRGAQVVIWQLFVDQYGNPDYFRHPDQYWCVY